MESNFIFNLSGTMIKLNDGKVFSLNDDCLLETTVYKNKFKESLSDKTLFDDNVIQQLLQGKTLLEILSEQKQDICIVDIANEDGFFDGRCQKISMIQFLEQYILGDKQTYILNKKALSEVLGETHFFIETKESFFIKEIDSENELNYEKEEFNDETLYSDDMTINFDKKANYHTQNFNHQSICVESKEDEYQNTDDEKHQDILNYSYEKAPVLETNEETDDILPLTDSQEDVKDICDNVMIKDGNNDDVMKAKDLVIEKECFSNKKPTVSDDILLSK